MKSLLYLKKLFFLLLLLIGFTITAPTYATQKVHYLETQQDGKKITGTVVDENGEPMPGVNIVVKGIFLGTSTDADGKYTLLVPNTDAVLEFTFIGYVPQEVKLEGKSVVDVTMKPEYTALEEIVVVGYGTQKKVNLSGAVSTVETKMLVDRPVVNIGQALQGVVANLNVSVGSGQATNSPSYNIRGFTSLTGGSPLIIIDGVIVDNSQLNRMNPTDIESISVLKDASSSAIYGSRAAYGVMLVTTKKGKDERLVINYNNNLVARKIVKLPEIISDPYIVAQTRNIMSSPWYNLYDEVKLDYAKKCSEDPNTTPYFVDEDGSYVYFGQTDWVKESYKKAGFSMAHNMDISGKTDKLNYFFSVGYNFQDGIIKYGTDQYNRYNLRSKLDFQLTDWWQVGNNTNFVTSDYDAPEYLDNWLYWWNINRASPMDVPKNPNGTWTSDGASLLGNLLEGGRKNRYETNVSTQFTTKLNIVKDVFFVQGNFAYVTNKNKGNGCSLPVAYYNGPDLPVRYFDEVSYAYGNTTDTKHVMFDAFGTFQKTFNNKHAVLSMVGFNQEEYRYDYMNLDRYELISTSLPTFNLATGDKNVGQNISTWTLRGAFARLNYIFADKYILEFNGRYDGTSRFPKVSRFTFNPSGSVAWVFSKESFLEKWANVLSFGKLRLSFGSLGNQDVSAYAYLATMGSGKIWQILDGEQPVYVSAPGLVSGNLTWERVFTSNIGLDLNFFNNRLAMTGDVYLRQTKDMLTAGATLPAVLGTSVPRENAADLETKGWEITIGWKDKANLAGKPLNYNVNFNLADSRSFITKFANETGTLSDYYKGYEIGEIWGMTTEGFFTSKEDVKSQDQLVVTSYPGTRPVEPGDIKFKDLNGDKKIDYGKRTLDDHGDYHIIGNNRQRFTFGLSAGADWNGFDFNVFFQGVGKRDYCPGASDLFFWGIYSQPWTNITYGNYYDRWTEENPNGYFPRFKSYVAEGTEAAIPQTRYMQNAAYIRLKNLTAGYTIPKAIMGKASIDRLRIFFSGDLLFEFSGLYKYYKVDPEGLGGQMYPFQRSYSFGLNVTF